MRNIHGEYICNNMRKTCWPPGHLRVITLIAGVAQDLLDLRVRRILSQSTDDIADLAQGDLAFTCPVEEEERLLEVYKKIAPKINRGERHTHDLVTISILALHISTGPLRSSEESLSQGPARQKLGCRPVPQPFPSLTSKSHQCFSWAPYMESEKDKQYI